MCGSFTIHSCLFHYAGFFFNICRIKKNHRLTWSVGLQPDLYRSARLATISCSKGPIRGGNRPKRSAVGLVHAAHDAGAFRLDSSFYPRANLVSVDRSLSRCAAAPRSDAPSRPSVSSSCILSGTCQSPRLPLLWPATVLRPGQGNLTLPPPSPNGYLPRRFCLRKRRQQKKSAGHDHDSE